MYARHSRGLNALPMSKDGKCNQFALSSFVTATRKKPLVNRKSKFSLSLLRSRAHIASHLTPRPKRVVTRKSRSPHDPPILFA